MTKLTSSFAVVLHEVSTATLTTEIVFFFFFLLLPFSPMGIAAPCFPVLLNVYSSRHGGGVISELQ